MKEQLITFETAKLAREQGFYSENSSMYKPDGKIATKASDYIFCTLYCRVSQDILQRWLEETHDIYIDTDTMTEVNRIVGFNFFIRSYKFFPVMLTAFDDKYEGLEKTLQKALTLIE